MADEPQQTAQGGVTSVGEEQRTLSQNEIDNLLGVDKKEDNKFGIQALLDKALLQYERLPMLEIVFDRYVRSLSTTLRNFTSDNVDVTIESINSMRFEDYINSIPLPALLVVFQAVEWENFGLINVDSSLTFSLVDVLLGGGRSNRPVRIEGRPYTTIEQDIIKTVVTYMLDDMSAAFNPVTPATFRYERMESNPRFATITRPANAIILISMRIDMEERGGKAEIMFPYSTLEPVKEILQQMFTGEKFGNDDQWERHFAREVKSANINVEAIFEQKNLNFGDVANLQVGTTVVLDHQVQDDVIVRCNGIDLMHGKMGCTKENIAVRITDISQQDIKRIL